MVNSEIFRKRLGKIEEYLSILDRLRKYTIDEFVGDPERYGSAERFLHLSIEAINDLGNHMIANLNLGEVNWQSDIPKILFERGYLSSELQDKWIKMIGFRNVLVHEYLNIDHELVYDVLQNNLGDFRDLMAALATCI
jgi:uncharacterized protein YutE (UPF0331/DUF86 family)